MQKSQNKLQDFVYVDAYTVNQFLFMTTGTLFRNYSVKHWLAASNVRDPAFFINIGLNAISGLRREVFAMMKFL
jgi:hypothetical protein